jgi:uncharacterized protein with ACT and thioredoxin-like domain
VVFLRPRLARAGRTNRGGRNQVVGGQSRWVSVEGGGIRDACQVAVGFLVTRVGFNSRQEHVSVSEIPVIG